MSLNYKLETLDEVAEDQKGLYKEVNGSFILDVIGVKDVAEFNTVHTALGKERLEKKEYKNKLNKFGDYTPETFETLNNQIADLKLFKQGNSSEEIEKRLQDALSIKIAPIEKKRLEDEATIEELRNTLNNMNAEKETSSLKDKITKIVNSSNSSVKPEAHNDIYARAMLHELKYNKDVSDFVDSKGNDFNTWFNEQSKNSTWNKSSTGAGANGGSKGITENPFKTGDLKAQTELYKTDKARYDKLSNEK